MSAPARTPLSRITAVSAVAGCLLLTGCGSLPPHPARTGNDPAHVAGHLVSYRVDGHGAADITWSGTPGGTATRVTLPWQRTGQHSDGTHGVTLTAVLSQAGGNATCAITVDGRRVGSSQAQGSFGRAVCTTQATAATGGNAASDA
jgi:hypothetical protein